MANARAEIVYPTPEQVCEVNSKMIDRYGGTFHPPYNLQNPDALHYVLASISGQVYGVDRYPTIEQKAAALTYHIITRHVFFDGNKRTAVHTAWEFLAGNGVVLNLDESVIDLSVEIANG